MFFICDGNIIGSGNDRRRFPDPEPLLFKSVGEGSKQLNYGKVYSSLYGYMVVVKVGKPSARTKPGNHGKRDLQILLMHYLNRVHFDAPMTPLELEIYHQMRNYISMVDAGTTVEPDSLNRLVACCADDSSIIGICGETKLDNEQMSCVRFRNNCQVYEYYISHHLAKGFESLSGSVTCLSGCSSLWTADKGRPIIISNRIIDEYSEPNVDTLDKKILLSLGEARFLTTLMMKHFPTYKMKFSPDAIAHTISPHRWSILLSQRRRWINSTVHNLCELIFLPELCDFCCFSMRFFVFIDLLGTTVLFKILPATAVYASLS
ncbi:chitin synthase-domain-containing protein [Gautieria morchelliformis]|nr:chitin synthase-domain-containing protein [Gautieria morchelliformis]